MLEGPIVDGGWPPNPPEGVMDADPGLGYGWFVVGGAFAAACRVLWRIACRLFWNLSCELRRQASANSQLASCVRKAGTHHICTLRADIPSFFASSMRSSVEGNAVRL